MDKAKFEELKATYCRDVLFEFGYTSKTAMYKGKELICLDVSKEDGAPVQIVCFEIIPASQYKKTPCTFPYSDHVIPGKKVRSLKRDMVIIGPAFGFTDTKKGTQPQLF